MAHNFHNNAAALIIAAAKQSGLLDDVAKALCFIDNVPNPMHMDCPACELLSDLTDRFDELTDDNAVGRSLEKFFRELACDRCEYSEDELRPYFTVPFDVHVETAPPRFSVDFNTLFNANFAKTALEAARVKFMQQIKANRANASQ